MPAQLGLLTYSQIFDDQIIFQAIIYEMHRNKHLGMKLTSQWRISSLVIIHKTLWVIVLKIHPETASKLKFSNDHLFSPCKQALICFLIYMTLAFVFISRIKDSHSFTLAQKQICHLRQSIKMKVILRQDNHLWCLQLIEYSQETRECEWATWSWIRPLSDSGKE